MPLQLHGLEPLHRWTPLCNHLQVFFWAHIPLASNFLLLLPLENWLKIPWWDNLRCFFFARRRLSRFVCVCLFTLYEMKWMFSWKKFIQNKTVSAHLYIRLLLKWTRLIFPRCFQHRSISSISLADSSCFPARQPNEPYLSAKTSQHLIFNNAPDIPPALDSCLFLE